jgi:hypothetical protein
MAAIRRCFAKFRVGPAPVSLKFRIQQTYGLCSWTICRCYACLRLSQISAGFAWCKRSQPSANCLVAKLPSVLTSRNRPSRTILRSLPRPTSSRCAAKASTDSSQSIRSWLMRRYPCYRNACARNRALSRNHGVALADRVTVAPRTHRASAPRAGVMPDSIDISKYVYIIGSRLMRASRCHVEATCSNVESHRGSPRAAVRSGRSHRPRRDDLVARRSADCRDRV